MATTITRRKTFQLWLVCAWLFQFSPYLEGKTAEGLYKSFEDDVVVLVANNFYHKTLLSDKAWMVEFYSSWCGHCVHFAPTWKKFATDVKAWKSVIAVAAIDCGNAENHIVCQDEHVMGYPSMKEFPPNAKNGSGVIYKGNRDIAGLRQELVRYIMAQRPLPNWPRLDPANTSDVFQLYEQTKSDGGSAVFVIFEAEKSDFGAEVMLDLSATECLNKQILRLQGTDQPLLSKWSVSNTPALYVWPVDGNPVEMTVESPSREGFVEALRDYYTKNMRAIGKEEKKTEKPPIDADDGSDMTDRPEETIKISNDTKNHAYLADIESALHYSLRLEVSSRKEIIGEELIALRSYVYVLNKYFPARGPVAEFLSGIDQRLQDTNAMDGIPIKTWISLINSGTTSGWLPAEQNWVGCQGSQSRYRGYPCSMWTLFHVLTVMQAEIDQDNHRSNSVEVLEAMKEYITNFFSCTECRTNFAKECANLLQEVDDSEGAILWLWKTHNRVNRHLKGDETEDPAFPKGQFPSRSLCQKCYSSTDQSMNEREVLKYLKHRYSAANLNLTGALALNGPQVHPRQVKRSVNEGQLRHDILSRVKRKKYSAKHLPAPKGFTVLGVTFFDISLCLVLNICCIGLVIIVYLVFFRRRKLKACYACLS